MTPAIRWALFAMLAPTVPFLIFHLIEHPMIQVGRRIANYWLQVRETGPMRIAPSQIGLAESAGGVVARTGGTVAVPAD